MFVPVLNNVVLSTHVTYDEMETNKRDRRSTVINDDEKKSISDVNYLVNNIVILTMDCCMWQLEFALIYVSNCSFRY